MPVKQKIDVGRPAPMGALNGLTFDAAPLADAGPVGGRSNGSGRPYPLFRPAAADTRAPPSDFSCIIGQDIKMKAVFRQIQDAAPYDYPVHLSGATGTGKELVARAIHDHSPRRRGAFVAVNCGALPENLVESELFGHVKGAFSGADRCRKGRFERAHRGTLFLDEVSDLPPYVQVRLLRVLQCGEFEKVGGERTVGVDVRVISATNKPLKEEMKAGRFRQDLYYRLNVVPIHMPPLKARRGDIALLARHFLDLAVACHHRQPVLFTPTALSAMVRYDWPGNVRELQNAVHFSFVRARGRVIDAVHLPHEIQQAACAGRTCRLNALTVTRALNHCGGNKSKAAQYLGVGRATLYRFLTASSPNPPGP